MWILLDQLFMIGRPWYTVVSGDEYSLEKVEIDMTNPPNVNHFLHGGAHLLYL